jgi:hypothetical protein
MVAKSMSHVKAEQKSTDYVFPTNVGHQVVMSQHFSVLPSMKMPLKRLQPIKKPAHRLQRSLQKQFHTFPQSGHRNLDTM